MTEEKAGGYISRIVFNDGTSVDIQRNDIVIFVGPNNAGKSQALTDIYNLSARESESIVVQKIEIQKNDLSVFNTLEKVSIGNSNGTSTNYHVLGKTITYNKMLENNYNKSETYEGFRDLFLINLDTSTRLNICKAPSSITRDDPKQHPIQYAAFEPKYRQWLTNSFKQAFGKGVIPNISHGADIPLYISNPIKLKDEYSDEQERQEAYAEALSCCPKVQDQGDGIKSFTGILLYLMLDYYRTFLIDEPESFLHPPQARIMGQIIGGTLSDQQQAFISTHSEEIIKGLLEVCPERIKVIRITREEDINSFSVLENNDFSKIWEDPILRYSNIMSSLFYKTVVLCESDADCKFYSIIEEQIAQFHGNYPETLFIQSGGKQRMAKIAKALRSLNIDIKVIPDLDIINDASVLQNLLNAFNIDWDKIGKDYKIIASSMEDKEKNISKEEFKEAIEQIINKTSEIYLSREDIRSIKELIKTQSKWDNIKQYGEEGFPAGDASDAYCHIKIIMNQNGIYPVPVGELENFIREVGGHGTQWVNNVIEKYPDFDDPVYDNVKKFICEIIP